MSSATIAKPNKTLTFVRSCIFMLLWTVATIIYCPIMVLTFILPLRQRYQVVRGYAWINILALRWICGLRYRVEGRENIPDEPAVMLCKHMSTYENFVFLVELPPAVFIAKQSLLWIPFFGWGMAALRFITIDRSRGKTALKKILVQAKQRFSLGLSVIIYPEGTRMAPGASVEHKAGGAILASSSGAPLLPVVHNAGEFWPRHSLLKWPGEVTFVIKPALESRGVRSEHLRQRGQQVLEETYQELHVPARFPY